MTGWSSESAVPTVIGWSRSDNQLPEHPYRWLFTALFALLTLFASVGIVVGRWTHDTLFDTDA